MSRLVVVSNRVALPGENRAGGLAVGLLGAYRAETTVMNQLSLGLVAFGLGMVGLLKTAIEMREHHRLDRAPQGEPA